MLVHTVQAVLNGAVTTDGAHFLRYTTKALSLHGAKDPVVVIYPHDLEVGIVCQWNGKEGDVRQEFVSVLEEADLLKDLTIGEVNVTQESRLSSLWASATYRLRNLFRRSSDSSLSHLSW